MNVLVVSGIWPPDVGGPASHAPELAAFLHERGHGVRVLVTASAPPEPRPYPVDHVSRRLPAGARHVAVAAVVARRARRADVVYATSMLGRSALGAAAARRPLVVKLTGDEAYERARRRGLFAGDLEEFQRGGGGPVAAALRRARDLALAQARHVFVPSAFLREVALGWGLPPERVSVLPNAAPDTSALPAREELRRGLGLEDATLALAFAGRLTEAKALDVALAALAEVEDVSLLVVGDGPDRAGLEALAARLGLAGRVRFLGPLPRERVLEVFHAADGSLLSSRWENFPHSVVEALAAGAPPVATAVGGVTEVVRDGENGLLVAPGDAAALAAALRRYRDDGELRGRLRAAAAPSVEALRPERLLARIEERLEEAARP